MKEPTEKQLSKAFYKRVKILQAYNQLSQDILVIHIPNEQIGGKGWTLELLRMGMVSGTPDYLILIKGGRCGFLEFKRNAKAKMSTNQKVFKSQCDILGIPHFVVWDIDQAIERLKEMSGKPLVAN